LADGITEDIITDLARFRDIDVIARNSTETYKGKAVDVRQVGRDLNVRYVLEGSIQRQGDRVRVTGQLIDARSGAHVWTDRWDRPAADLFAVQTDVAERVSSSLGGYNALLQAGRPDVKRKRPADLSAYDLYLLGTELKHRRAGIADFQEANRMFNRAIAIDPHFARAYVGRAWTHLLLTFYGPPYDFASGVAGMEADARKAIGLDPQDAEAHAVLAESLYYQGRFSESRAEYDTALQLNPSSADIVLLASGILCMLGEPERAAELADRAVGLNPAIPTWYTFYLAPAYYFVGRDADVVQVVERLPPDRRLAIGWLPLAMSLGCLGRTAEAAAAREAVLAASPGFSAETALASDWRTAREQEKQRFVEGVRRAGLPVCADAAQAAGMAAGERLPACEVERAAASRT
jgi:TolB-like protein